jgi:hypothetical protein
MFNPKSFFEQLPLGYHIFDGRVAISLEVSKLKIMKLIMSQAFKFLSCINGMSVTVTAIGGVRAEVSTGPGAQRAPIGTVLGNPLCTSVKELPTLQGRPRAPLSELPPLVCN